MIQIQDKGKCCGCTACKSICPKECITMTPDEEGFLYPIVDTTACINCGLCEKVCPILNKVNIPKQSKTAYVVQTSDIDVLKNSTSGGFSDALYRTILDKGGYVCGCIYDKKWMPYHIITNDYEKLPLFRGSKYAQSNLNDIFVKIKQLLRKDKYVCFVGTPCQVAGLKKYLQKEYTKLITVDLVCRSIPSPALLSAYLKWQEKKYKSQIQYVNHRNKTYGYHHGTLVIRFKNGRTYSGSNRIDPFMKTFHSDVCSRPSCYECVFKTKTRCSDFTVFDSWQPESLSAQIEDNNLGYSNVIIHTNKGWSIFQNMHGIDKWETSAEKMFQFTGGMESETVNRPQGREEFYKKLIIDGFEKTVFDFINITNKDQLIEKIKMILYKIGLLHLIRK